MEELGSLESSMGTGVFTHPWVSASKQVTLPLGSTHYFTKNTNLCSCNCKDRLPF